MPIRMTGINSGMDTESIIKDLVKVKSAKKEKLIKEQTKMEWKQEAWKELNAKVYGLYTKTLSNLRFKSDFMKKATKLSDSSVASVVTSGSAVDGVQQMQVNSLAKSGYLTGGVIDIIILYWCFSFWLTSLFIIGSCFIHFIRTDANVFFLMAE